MHSVLLLHRGSGCGAEETWLSEVLHECVFLPELGLQDQLTHGTWTKPLPLVQACKGWKFPQEAPECVSRNYCLVCANTSSCSFLPHTAYCLRWPPTEMSYILPRLDNPSPVLFLVNMLGFQVVMVVVRKPHLIPLYNICAYVSVLSEFPCHHWPAFWGSRCVGHGNCRL